MSWKLRIERRHAFDESNIRGFSNEEIENIAEGAFGVEKINSSIVAAMFGVPLDLVTPSDVEFFKKYVRIAGAELVRGYILSPERVGVSWFFIRSYLNKMKRTMWNDSAYHDISHTMVEVFRHMSMNPISSLIPDFRKTRYASNGPFEDEFFNFLWPDYPNRDKLEGGVPLIRTNTLRLLKMSKSKKDFKEQFMLRASLGITMRVPELALDTILDDMYDHYESNPRLMLDMFINRAASLIRVYS